MKEEGVYKLTLASSPKRCGTILGLLEHFVLFILLSTCKKQLNI